MDVRGSESARPMSAEVASKAVGLVEELQKELALFHEQNAKIQSYMQVGSHPCIRVAVVVGCGYTNHVSYPFTPSLECM